MKIKYLKYCKKAEISRIITKNYLYRVSSYECYKLQDLVPWVKPRQNVPKKIFFKMYCFIDGECRRGVYLDGGFWLSNFLAWSIAKHGYAVDMHKNKYQNKNILMNEQTTFESELIYKTNGKIQ